MHIDLGRMMLDRIPIVNAYERRLFQTPRIRVPGYWQAAQGRVQKPMMKDGARVWVPKSGPGGQGVGNVAWRLHVPRKDVYYIWARMRSSYS